MKTHIGDTLVWTERLSAARLSKRWLLLAGAVVILSGCASAPLPPAAEIQAAERAISTAEQAQVVQYTTVELDTARKELAAARLAITEENMPQARRLALQAQLNAELALARADLIKAQAVNKDMQQSIDAVQQEAQRNMSGVKL